MNSLLNREGMKGQVQCIYFDPPYGIKYASNWQMKLNSRDVKDNDKRRKRQTFFIVQTQAASLRTQVASVETQAASVETQVASEEFGRMRGTLGLDGRKLGRVRKGEAPV